MAKRTIIDAKHRQLFPNFSELKRYKDLFLTLAWRDFRVRYAQTTIGFLWAFIQPIVTLVILSLVFNRFANVNTDPIPHLIFTSCGLITWTYFSFVMTNSGKSIIESQGMIKKIYFPRLIIPLSKAVVGLIDMGVTVVLLIGLMIYYGIAPASTAWLAPFFLLIGMMAALGVGIWLSALTIRFRDFQHIIPFMVQIGMFITPVAYPAEKAVASFPGWAASLYYLNPMAGVVQGFRWSIFGGDPPGNMIYLSFAVVLLLFVTSLMYFKRVEDEIADFV
jgi:lipopolysaccharide transport system permease protein